MIVCVGESLIDFVPEDESGSRYLPKPGGSPMNCAVAGARLGGSVSFAGTISEDFFGDIIAEHLSTNGVDLSLVNRVTNPTTLAFVSTTTAESARYAFYAEGSADRALRTDELPERLLPGTLLQIGSISLIADPASEAILRLAESHHNEHIVVVDPNVRESLISDESDFRGRIRRATASAALFKTSVEDLAWLYPDSDEATAAKKVLNEGPKLVIVTDGGAGSRAYTRSERVRVPGETVTVVDTIGAGDSYMGALLVWLEEREIKSRERLGRLSASELTALMEFATHVSAITCTRAGGDPPQRDEL